MREELANLLGFSPSGPAGKFGAKFLGQHPEAQPILLPQQNFMLREGDNVFSSHQPHAPVTIDPGARGNDFFGHSGFTISTVGLLPDGNLPGAGRGQARALSNFTEMDIDAQQAGHDYVKWLRAQGMVPRGPEDLRDIHSKGLAKRLGLESLAAYPSQLSPFYAKAVVPHMSSGLLHGWTGGNPSASRLVAIRNGQQVVSDPSEIISSTANSGLVGAYGQAGEMSEIRRKLRL